MTDVVYADTLASYGFSHRLAEQLRDDSFDRVASLVDTRGEGVPVIVFNPLAWPRTEVVEVDVGFVAPDVHGFHVVAPDGATIAAQIVASESHQDGALRSVRVAFLARDLPALGWATFRIVGTARPGGASTAESLVLGGGDSEGAAVVGSLENESFKVVVDGTGAIRSLFDKARNEEWLSAPANVVARSPDDGDLWEIGHRLDGGMFVAATTKQPVPDGKSGLLSSQESGKATWIRGPVFSELRVAHPFGSGSFTTRLRVAAGVARVDVETELVNQEKRVRYQALFPTKVRDGRCLQSIPFGAVERPLGVEYPAQDWVDLGDETRGMTLLNVGLAGNVATDGTLMLSLLRSEDLRGYDEGRSSESGFELGVPRTFRYALVPHAGTWREAASFRRGLEWNAPLVVRKTTTHAGELPARFRFVEVADANVVLTSARPGSDGTLVLRLYEACGRATRAATIRFAAKVTSACDADLLERAGTSLTADGDALRVDFHPFEIKTLRVQLAR